MEAGRVQVQVLSGADRHWFVARDLFGVGVAGPTSWFLDRDSAGTPRFKLLLWVDADVSVSPMGCI
jgi:hypothetical protein